ncbi:cation-transporting P-type ATPase [Nocardia higoensis]|uniref:Cation-transporting P-type ATPase n=1 Tax=Nocardia higoensis TaxID=228599 RepID=A0ABS0D472_9NOCA|nr:cation-transporting P-type ATPase [Nocardia higoensis]MBF6353126.1 cation-transporting P-type ATPase [Nocardia higoensis]
MTGPPDLTDSRELLAAGGLTDAEAAERLRRDGPNALPAPKRPNPLALLAAQLTHFFAVMLWVAAGLALIAGMPALAVAIAVVVVLNGAFAFAQEYRADRAAERLRDLLPVRARVRRGGRLTVVDSTALVLDDLVVLRAGDRICADAEVLDIHAKHLEVDESMLTGESRAVHTEPGARLFAGTYVVSGQGEARVTAVGPRTRLAGLAAVTEHATRPRSPLSRQLHRVVRMVALIAIGVGVLSFAVFAVLGRDTTQSVLFSIGVTVALVPEGLLPTVTLSLARAGQRMAAANALVRRLEAVETLGATTFVCTDKTGTLTRNEMQVVEVWTAAGTVIVEGEGYRPEGEARGGPDAVAATRAAADSAARCSPDAHVREDRGRWLPVGDPLEVAVHVLAGKLGVQAAPPPLHREPFDNRIRLATVTDRDGLHLIGAPEAVFAACRRDRPANADTGTGTISTDTDLVTARLTTPTAAVDTADTAIDTADAEIDTAATQLEEMTARGLRVIAVAHTSDPAAAPRVLALLAFADPPRPDVAAAITACRTAGIKIAMVTGDHPGTATAIATDIGFFGPDHSIVVEGKDLPADDDALADLLERDGVVVARVAPEEKLRITLALQKRGHVVAMTGDGVNDGPALRTADIGVAMGASGTDVAREAADLVLLDDHFGTIVAAVELGRATFANIRRFLTYHLTDNVAELTPFAVWAASGGSIPLGFTVLQVLALDIGTDMLPALALGAEPPNPRTMSGPARTGSLVDGRLLRRAFGVLGPVEAGVGMIAFLLVLGAGGWTLGTTPDAALLATASGTLFTAVVLGQLTNAFLCRSETRWFGVTGWRGNPLLLVAIAIELALLVVFLWVPPLPGLLGGTPPDSVGWAAAAAAIPAMLMADTAYKAWRGSRRRRSSDRARSGRSSPPRDHRSAESSKATAGL